jgi:hypothetical protein
MVSQRLQVLLRINENHFDHKNYSPILFTKSTKEYCMKKASIVTGLLLMITASATFSQQIEFYYGEIKAVNVGYYGSASNDIYCAVQVGTNEYMGTNRDILTNQYPPSPILLVKKSNPLAKEIYTLLLSAQLNGQKVHLRTYDLNINLGSYNSFNEILEASVGDHWLGWPW